MHNIVEDEFELDRTFLLSRQASKWTMHDADVIPSWIAEMDFMPPRNIRQAIDRIVSKHDFGYPRRALMPAERVVGEMFERRMTEKFGWRAEPGQTQPVTDLVQATMAAVIAFTEPGDGVAVHMPCYPPFREAIQDAGRRLVEIPMIDTGSTHVPDMDALAGVDPQTSLLILCNPHNPTGRAFTRDELERIASIALEKGMIIFSDEIHCDFVYDQRSHVPTASLGQDAADITVTANSPSKSFNIPGLRCGVMHFGSTALRERFHARIPRILLGKPSSISIDATVAAWSDCEPWLESIVAHLASQRDYLCEAITSSMPGLRLYRPEASFLAWIDCSAMGWTKPAAAVFLDQARIAFSPGESFSDRHSQFVRLNFATSRKILSDKLERMRKLVQAISA